VWRQVSGAEHVEGTKGEAGCHRCEVRQTILRWFGQLERNDVCRACSRCKGKRYENWEECVTQDFQSLGLEREMIRFADYNFQ